MGRNGIQQMRFESDEQFAQRNAIVYRRPSALNARFALMTFISLLTLVPSAACSPTVSTFNHSPLMAAEEAQRFAQVALIDRHFQKAYVMFAESGKRGISLEKFIETMDSTHPTAFPLTVAAIEYEPVPGQRGMNIYLYGENGEERFYYRFVMEGEMDSDYRVSGLWRSAGLSPATVLRRRLDQPL